MTDTQNSATQDDLDTIRGIVTSARIALLTTSTAGGDLHSRPLATQDVEFDGDLWFFTADPSSKVEDIAHNPKVNASFETKKGYLSIAGTAEVVHDRAKIDEYWNTFAAGWFENGKDDPTVALIKVHADSAELWTEDQPRAITLLKVAKAAATGGTPDVGQARTVEL